jgi:hypothetical protein
MADDIDRKAFSEMQYATTDKTAVNLMGNKAEVTKEDVHNMLMAAGFTPGLGNIADTADAILYAAEGEFGNAALSVAAMIPFIGQAVSAKRALKIAKESGEKMRTLFRGSEGWHRGKMVREGKFVGGKSFPDMIWVTDKKAIASGYARKAPKLTQDVKANIKAMEDYVNTERVLLEFQVPESYMKKNFRNATGIWRPGQLTGFFQGGLPKEFLTKVHR